jgi:hypothetical protein
VAAGLGTKIHLASKKLKGILEDRTTAEIYATLVDYGMDLTPPSSASPRTPWLEFEPCVSVCCGAVLLQHYDL